MVRPHVAAALLLAAAVVLVYGHAASVNGFAGDDFRFIVNNRFVGNEGAWWTAFTDPKTVDAVTGSGIVRPLRTLEFRLDRQLQGSAAFFHWHSVLWHVVAAWFVFGVLRRLLRHEGGAFFGTLAWALHPMQTESVIAISSRADVAMGACAAAALYFVLRSRGRDRWALLGLACGALAMLWKETAAVLPLLVSAVLWLRGAGDGASDRADRAARFRALGPVVAPWVALSCIYVVYRFSFGGDAAEHVTYRIGGSLAGTAATMIRAFGAYGLFAVFPARPGYDWYMDASRSFADPAVVVWGLVHVTALVLALRAAARGRPLALAALVLFVGALLPVANVPFDLGIPTTERFLYLPLLGLALLFGAAVRGVPRVRTAATFVCACLAAIAVVRCADWKDGDTLLSATLRSHPSVRAHAYFGEQARDEGWVLRRRAREATDEAERDELAAASRAALEDAVAHAEASIAAWKRQISPWPPHDHAAALPHVTASNASFALGRYEDALHFAEGAVAISPHLPQAQYNLAWALQRLDRPGPAAQAMQRALDDGQELGPAEGFRFFASIGRQSEAKGAWDDARTAYGRALSYDAIGRDAVAVRQALERLPR